MDGPLVFYVALLIGGAWLFASNTRALWEFWRFTPPSEQWTKNGQRLGTYGAMGAVAIGAFGMIVFGLIGLLN